MSKNTFKITVNGKELNLKTTPISSEIRLESNKYYSLVFNESIEQNLPLKLERQKILEERNLLNPEKDDKKIFDIRKDLKDLEISLRRAVNADGSKMSLVDGKAVALKMRKLRASLGEIGSALNGYFADTVESRADNERLEYFIYSCTVYADTGTRYWKSFEAFKAESSDVLITEATKSFLNVVTGADKNYDLLFYENKWLKNHKFLDDKNRLLDDNGRLIDDEGRMIDENGRFINGFGQFVDIYGNKVDEKGELLVVDEWEPAILSDPSTKVDSVSSTNPAPSVTS